MMHKMNRIGLIPENNEDYRIIEVQFGNRARIRNHKYFNPNIVKVVITEKELPKVHSVNAS